MKTAGQVIGQHGVHAGAAASEIVRRFKGAELQRAAEAWVEHFFGRDDAAFEDGHQAATLEIVRAAADGTDLRALIDDLFPLGDERTPRNAGEGLLAIWPQRHDRSAAEDALIAWASACDESERLGLAVAFARHARIAYEVLGPLEYGASDVPCFGCREHRRTTDDGSKHLLVLACRRERACEHHVLDDEVLRAIPLDAYLEEPELLCMIHLMLRDNAGLPPLIEHAARGGLQADRGRPSWCNAVGILCRLEPDDQERAVEALAAHVLSTPEPAEFWGRFFARARGHRLRRNLFSGRGWGKKNLRRKLAPLAKAFLDREVWPVEPWNQALAQREDDEQAGDVSERHRVVLGEGLLQRALDEAQSVEARGRALQALGTLELGGTRSAARALSKIEHPPDLATEARDVQTRWAAAERRGRLDADLAIVDAVELLL